MTETSLVPELAARAGITFEELVAMDGRGRLAQSLKSRFRRAPAERPRAAVVFGRWRRFARRWGSPILQFDPPRGAGPAAAIVLMLASAGYGVVKGGHVPEIAAEVQDICDAAANAAGFRISSVAMSGQ